jgi:hypothetical protein
MTKMGNRKLCGYDVNGWRDGVARNWVARPGDEEEVGVVRIVEGAVLPDVVLAGEGFSQRWIGGAQAVLAPHGRGGGWGKTFGVPERRQSIRSLIADETVSSSVLAAAFTGLAQGASHSVAAIADTEATTEQMQERVFAALNVARAGKALLVWRSVLSVLHAIQQRSPQAWMHDGARIGIIGHLENGFAFQTLRLRVETRGSTAVIAPERRQFGAQVDSRLGYEGLASAALAQLMALAPDKRSDHFASARAIGRLAFGLQSIPEPLRKANGDWDILNPPESLKLPEPDFVRDSRALLGRCDVVFFESLTEGKVRQEILSAMQAILDSPIVPLPPTAVAKGALIAAERYAAGETVYFDFLPQIATIVQGSEGAVSYNLIGESERLPAGSLYRSPKPARFALQAGQDKFHVFLKKETHLQPRRVLVGVGSPPRQAVPIDLWVEQVPAAGRAKILLQAPTLARQFSVDWDTAEILDQTWEELLSSLATPSPTIPKRLVLPCGMNAWEDSHQGPGLISLLNANAGAPRPDWDALATQLSARPFGQYCISSDGEVPQDVLGDTLAQFDELTDRALTALRDIVSGKQSPDNGPLKFVSWQFRRCPPEVGEMLLDAWTAMSVGSSHPFIVPQNARVLVRQGFGRIVTMPEQEKRAIELLLRYPELKWKARFETAAASFLLSRSDLSPTLLERTDVEMLGKRILTEFQQSVGTQYTAFQYAPFLLVGLLRWRLKSSRAIVVGADQLADRMASAVERVADDMSQRRWLTPRLERTASRWLPLLEQTLEELRGAGGNPDLLADIYNA